MTDSMKRAFDNAIDKIEKVYHDIERIKMNVNVEAHEVLHGKERMESLDHVDLLSAAMEIISQARYLVDYVRRKKS